MLLLVGTLDVVIAVRTSTSSSDKTRMIPQNLMNLCVNQQNGFGAHTINKGTNSNNNHSNLAMPASSTPSERVPEMLETKFVAWEKGLIQLELNHLVETLGSVTSHKYHQCVDKDRINHNRKTNNISRIFYKRRSARISRLITMQWALSWDRQEVSLLHKILVEEASCYLD